MPSKLLYPEIRSCSEVYGRMSDGPLSETPISGVINKLFLTLKIILFTFFKDSQICIIFINILL